MIIADTGIGAINEYLKERGVNPKGIIPYYEKINKRHFNVTIVCGGRIFKITMRYMRTGIGMKWCIEEGGC